MRERTDSLLPPLSFRLKQREQEMFLHLALHWQTKAKKHIKLIYTLSLESAAYHQHPPSNFLHILSPLASGSSRIWRGKLVTSWVPLKLQDQWNIRRSTKKINLNLHLLFYKKSESFFPLGEWGLSSILGYKMSWDAGFISCVVLHVGFDSCKSGS